MSYNINPNKDVSRATILAISDVSKVNEYTIGSSFIQNNPISLEHNRRLINEIIDNTFDERKGTCEVSSSQCSSVKLQSSGYSYDKRLEYWKNVLRERQALSLKLQKQTNKNQWELLYNRLVTVDERDKFTVKNLMDNAERLNPTTVSAKRPSKLKEKCNIEMLTVPELEETLPLTEKSKTAKTEITGLPKEVRKELLGKVSQQGSKKLFSWLNSAYLEKRIEEKHSDIERILEYYPDIENLQIVGEGLLGYKKNENFSDIQIISSNDICQISSDTPLEEDLNEVQTGIGRTPSVRLFEYAVKINDQEFFISKSCRNNSLQTVTNFTCFPFESDIKKIFTIQNIGRKVLDFQWVHSSFYYKNSTLLKCRDSEFIFDNLPFRLCSGQIKEVFIKFQPRRVCVVKSKWVLKVKPSLFKRKMKGIAMSLCGKCTVPLEYERKLDEIQAKVIEKSNQYMMKTLASNLAALATELQPVPCYCPYQRSLNEMELFEQLNLGFKCDRYNDLELLKDLYKRTKKPRDKAWDLQVSTLRNTILNVPHAETRALLFNELCGILNSMKGISKDLDAKTSDKVEQDRSRFLYVRNIILTATDEWVTLAEVLEETFYQTSLQAIAKEFSSENQVGEELNKENKNSPVLPQEEVERRQFVVEKHVRKLKPYRDSLYMQTYTLFCDFAENIVSIIESNL